MISSALIEEYYLNYIKNRTISTDTRTLREGDVFIALKGDQFNGNQFARKASEAGAGIIFVDEEEYVINEKCILVPDTLRFLQQVASYHRNQLNIPVIGITGTNGKTTTKELCHAVLSARYRVVSTKGNLNNHIGVPLTLLSMNDSTEIGIVEMGANHPEEIKFLCNICNPDLGIITNIGEAHLEGFGSFQNIVATKRELYDFIASKKGTLFVNSDDPLLMELSVNAKRETYGSHGSLSTGKVQQKNPYLVFSLRTTKGDLYIKTRLTGVYNFPNAMAAACVGKYFKITPEEIRDALESYRPENNRSQIIQTSRNTIIMDAYNANPGSMKAAITNFADFKNHPKVIILGEMLELGEYSAEAHEEILQLCREFDFLQIFLVGKEFQQKKEEFVVYFNNTCDLIDYLKNNPLTSSYILIKGSRGNKLETIVEYL